MRLLVFGQTGQVAREMARRCPPGVEAAFAGRAVADLSDPAACAAAVMACEADAVVNVAAWTAVDAAESQEAAARLVNGAAPEAMAKACAARNLPFLHVSTDYVFDGAGTTPFAPGDPTNPSNAYGRTKRAGEVGIEESGARALILRTSWVFSAHGSNFVKTMLRLGAEREDLRVVDDQIGGPTPAATIADALFVLARGMVAGHEGGTYHFAGAPDVSWADFAREIMDRAGLPCRIAGIPSTDYPTPAPRPANSRLDCTTLTRDFGLARPDWRAGLAQILDDPGATA